MLSSQATTSRSEAEATRLRARQPQTQEGSGATVAGGKRRAFTRPKGEAVAEPQGGDEKRTAATKAAPVKVAAVRGWLWDIRKKRDCKNHDKSIFAFGGVFAFRADECATGTQYKPFECSFVANSTEYHRGRRIKILFASGW